MNHATMPIAEIERLLAENPAYTYDDFVASMAPHCRCRGYVCAGVLAGGFCDTWLDPATDADFDDLEPEDFDRDCAWNPDDLDANGEMP